MSIFATVAIMHDQRRSEMLIPLMAKFFDPPEQIMDIFVADGSNGGPCLALFKALYFGPPNRTHVIVIEDDAILPRNFLQGALNAIKSRPEDMLYLFASDRQAGKQMKMARDRGCSWAEATPTRTVGNVAACIPMSIAEPFLDWACSKESIALCAALWPHKPWSGDSRLFYWMVNRHESFPLVSAISIADHNESDPQKDSLIGTHQTVARRSPKFIGVDSDASEVKFNSEVLKWSPNH